jgi:hypothetical protein
MSQYRTINRLLLMKIESSVGVDPTPVVGSNALLVEAPSAFPDLRSTQTNEVTSTLDNRGPIPAGAQGRLSFGLNLKHSGTAGTPPEAGVPLRACGMAELITAAAVTGTCQSGSTSSTIKLAAGASAVDDAYNGMPINTTGGTGSGQTAYITDYVGSTKVATISPAWTVTPDNTTTYSIPINVRYAPVSSALEYVTAYLYENRADAGQSRLNKLLGAQGSWSLSMGVRGLAKLQFNFLGLPVAPSDVSAPGSPTYQSSLPQPWLAATTYLGDVSSRANSINLDFGANVQVADAPDASLGFDVAGITGRQVAGTINPPKTLQSSINPFSLWQNSTGKPFVTKWGPSAGNQIAIIIPSARLTGVSDADVNGFGHDSLPFRAIGDNSGVYLCFH